MQFRLDHAHGNFAQCLNTSNKSACKAAFPEWGAWQQYQKKHAARAGCIAASPRLKPVIEGDDVFDVNPSLLMLNNGREGKINCALLTTVGMPFSERFLTKHAVYDKSEMKKLSPADVINFHSLSFMEIQYSGSCCTR